MFLLVGLGNPGHEYENTRHNIGFMAVDEIVRRHNFTRFQSKYNGLVSSGTIGGEKVYVIKPETFMNKSGVSVAQIVNFYKIPVQNVIVLYDELDLPTGKIRVKSGGGTGGHNGLKSLDSHIKKDYVRIRIGIDHPGDKAKVSGYVLGRFKSDEIDIVGATLDAIAGNIDYVLDGNQGEFMNKVALATRK